MKTAKIITGLFVSGLLLSGFIFFQNKNTLVLKKEVSEQIHWHTFQEAVELSKKEKKKVFIDVSTSWCGWCKRMDATTFIDPVIIRYLNDKYYSVRLDAEMKDTVVFNNHTFVNPNPTVPRSTHQLASALLNDKLSYPTTVYLDEDFNLLTQVPGYLPASQLEPIVKYFGTDSYKTLKWEDYSKTFQSEIPPPPPTTGPAAPLPH